jgi:hypothetical protein
MVVDSGWSFLTNSQIKNDRVILHTATTRLTEVGTRVSCIYYIIEALVVVDIAALSRNRSKHWVRILWFITITESQDD